MKNLKLKSLAAVAVLLSTTSAFAVQVTLITDGLRSGSGSNSSKSLAGTATAIGAWSWDGTTLDSNGTTLNATTGCGPACTILTDNVTGMVVNTSANTTTATSYTCAEGNFLANFAASGCMNVDYSPGIATLSTSMAYNVGGDANCINRTITPAGLDTDVSTGAPRGLGTGSGGSCDPQATAYGQWDIFSDNSGTIGGFLTLWNNAGPTTCITTTTKDAACANVTKLVLQSVPVPAAIWLFGSGLGLMGLARRRVGASA